MHEGATGAVWQSNAVPQCGTFDLFALSFAQDGGLATYGQPFQDVTIPARAGARPDSIEQGVEQAWRGGRMGVPGWRGGRAGCSRWTRCPRGGWSGRGCRGRGGRRLRRDRRLGTKKRTVDVGPARQIRSTTRAQRSLAALTRSPRTSSTTVTPLPGSSVRRTVQFLRGQARALISPATMNVARIGWRGGRAGCSRWTRCPRDGWRGGWSRRGCRGRGGRRLRRDHRLGDQETHCRRRPGATNPAAPPGPALTGGVDPLAADLLDDGYPAAGFERPQNRTIPARAGARVDLAGDDDVARIGWLGAGSRRNRRAGSAREGWRGGWSGRGCRGRGGRRLRRDRRLGTKKRTVDVGPARQIRQHHQGPALTGGVDPLAADLLDDGYPAAGFERPQNRTIPARAGARVDLAGDDDVARIGWRGAGSRRNRRAGSARWACCETGARRGRDYAR